VGQLLIDKSPAVGSIIWGFLWIALGIKSVAQILVFGTPKDIMSTKSNDFSNGSTKSGDPPML